MTPLSPERLLADATWLRRLAGRLCGDADLAEDVQQEVELTTLLRPQCRDRSWLAIVARNVAVSLRRRRSAEQRRVAHLPLPEPARSAAELAAEAELQQQLLQDDEPVLEQCLHSAADGHFEIGPLPPGSYGLQATFAGLLFPPMLVSLARDEHRTLAARGAVRPARLQVQLMGRKHVLSRARVELVAGDLRLRTHEGGVRRTIANVTPGRYRLVVSLDGEELQATEVQLTAGGEERREFVLR